MDFVGRGGRGCCPAPALAPGPRAGAGGGCPLLPHCRFRSRHQRVQIRCHRFKLNFSVSGCFYR